MNPNDLPESAIFDEHDLQELDQLLQNLQNEDALKLDAVQGVMCALILGPKPLQTSEWLTAIVGQEPEVEDADLIEPLYERLVAYYRALEHALHFNNFDPIFAEHTDDDGETHIDVGGWCQGFSMGVDLLAESWENQMQRDPLLIELLSPIVALGVDDGVFAEIADPGMQSLSEAERDELIRELPSRLQDLGEYWALIQQDLLESAKARQSGSLH